MLVFSNRPHASRSPDFGFTRAITPWILLYTYWDLHTEKPQSKFSFANRCKPIKCRVSLFPHVRKRYVQSGAAYHVFSRVSGTASWSFHSRLVGAVSYTAQAIALRGWREQMFLFAFLPSLILKVPLSTKAMSEKRFVIHDSSVEEYVESLEVSFDFIWALSLFTKLLSFSDCCLTTFV